MGLVVLGAVALGIVLFGDLPATRETGVIGRDYAGAEAKAGLGLWLEAAGERWRCWQGSWRCGGASELRPARAPGSMGSVDFFRVLPEQVVKPPLRGYQR